MNKTLLKAFVTAAFVVPVFLVVFTATKAQPVTASQDDVAVMYKKNTCFACHKADASKHFDPAKTDEHHIEVILNGFKGEKPPYMPSYSAKGIDEEKAAALVAHMRELRAAADGN